jgi:hypothetical protein
VAAALRSNSVTLAVNVISPEFYNATFVDSPTEHTCILDVEPPTPIVRRIYLLDHEFVLVIHTKNLHSAL